MSSEVTRRITPLNADQISEFIDNPLKQVPFEWRPLVWDLWSFFEHLMPTQLALCARIRHWIDSDGLTLEELREVFRIVRTPAVCSQYQFASQVLAGIPEKLEEVRKSARESEREEIDKNRIESNGRNAADRSLWREKLGPRAEVLDLADALGGIK